MRSLSSCPLVSTNVSLPSQVSTGEEVSKSACSNGSSVASALIREVFPTAGSPQRGTLICYAHDGGALAGIGSRSRVFTKQNSSKTRESGEN